MSRSDLLPRGPHRSFPAAMKSHAKGVVALLLIALGAVLGGCTTGSPVESSIPWNQPADWEGQIPGMSGSGSNVH